MVCEVDREGGIAAVRVFRCSTVVAVTEGRVPTVVVPKFVRRVQESKGDGGEVWNRICGVRHSILLAVGENRRCPRRKGRIAEPRLSKIIHRDALGDLASDIEGRVHRHRGTKTVTCNQNRRRGMCVEQLTDITKRILSSLQIDLQEPPVDLASAAVGIRIRDEAKVKVRNPVRQVVTASVRHHNLIRVRVVPRVALRLESAIVVDRLDLEVRVQSATRARPRRQVCLSAISCLGVVEAAHCSSGFV
mmetsp:Transcript_33055/g.38411  ORF Transcript_33055/g.38411 Transcript_33055/m.38411 type:complete len:247 (-) Transcript_33055:117-857(-)